MSDYPRAYIDYLVHFHGDRDWFECHEILEEYWKEQGMKDDVWVTLIQIAVGLYHERRGNRRGAEKMLNSALNAIKQPEIISLGLDAETLLRTLEECIKNVHSAHPFEDFNLPINDDELRAQCVEECLARKMIWQGKSDLTNEQLIHKHTLRDRSEIVMEREAKLKSRDAKR